ncbi:hypothetical protein C0992_001474, partial [Termitomyces sp. T32_za158]
MSEGNEGKDVRQKKKVRRENPFLDIEAQVDEEEDPEVEEDDNDDFIEDSLPVALDRSHSHHLLAVEQDRVESDTEWGALLARARARSRSQQLSSGESPHQSVSIPFDGVTCLWRVAVK